MSEYCDMKQESNYNLLEIPNGYEAFVQNDLTSESLNIAGAQAAAHNLGEEDIENLARELEEHTSYSNSELENKIEGRAAKAKVYERIKGNFENELKAASMVHSKSLDGRDRIAEMQLEVEYGIDPAEASVGHANWRMCTDFEMDEDNNYILGRGNLAHKMLRYADSKDNLNREKMSEAINNHVERDTIHHGGSRGHVESRILEEVEDQLEGSMIDIRDDFLEWATDE